MRRSNTDKTGKPFKKTLRDLVWAKRTPHVWGNDWGIDKYGNLINYHQYGKVSHRNGWDIDHSKPVSAGGTDHPNNLQPVQSHYNRYIKSDNYPFFG